MKIQRPFRCVKSREETEMKKGRIPAALCLVCLLLLAGGCRAERIDRNGEKELAYTVMKTEDIPEEVMKTMEEQGEEPYQLCYQDGEVLYLMRGYGKQETGGYSIQIESLSSSGATVIFRTKLLGPQSREEQKSDGSCPYIVVRTENQELPVLFEDS